MNPNDDVTKIIAKRKTSSSSSSKNVKKVFANKLPVTLVNDDDNNNQKNDDVKSNTSNRLLFESYLDSVAILGHDKTALFGSFGLFLLSLVLSMYMNGGGQHYFLFFLSSFQQSSSSAAPTTKATSMLTAEQERLYQNLGPIPPQMDDALSPHVVYHIDDLRDCPHNMTLLRQAYQRDGVVAIRGLLNDNDNNKSTLLQRLDAASAKHVQEEWDKQMQKLKNTNSNADAAGDRRPQKSQRRQGTQFFLNRNHLALTDPPFPPSLSNHSCSADNDDTEATSQSLSSSAAAAADDDDDDESNEMYTMNPFLETALTSQIPKMAAALLGLGDTATVTDSSGDNAANVDDPNNNNNLRLIRDIFLAKDDDPYICGWHVDDFGFWPVTADSPPGINAWIALDDYNVNVDGGGFALAIGSHIASWRNEAHFVTGASTTAPIGGYTSAKDLFERRTGSGTCNLKSSAPHLHRRMEETMRIYSKLNKGDVILHDRWLFHRTVPLNKNVLADKDDENDNDELRPPPPILRRYSIRYGPGSSVIPPGYGTELSVLWDDANGGKTANQVCDSRSSSSSSSSINATTAVYPWYPQAWPNVLERELASLQFLVQHQFPMALKRQEQHLKEMKPHRKRLARQQNRPTLAGNKR